MKRKTSTWTMPENIKVMKHDTDCNWCTRNDPQKHGKRAGNFRNRRTSRDHPNYCFVVTHSKSAQDRFVSDVLGVLTSFGSSNIILALPSNPAEAIIPARDPALKSSPSTSNCTAHTFKKIYYCYWALNWKWPMRNDIRHFPPCRDELKR